MSLVLTPNKLLITLSLFLFFGINNSIASDTTFAQVTTLCGQANYCLPISTQNIGLYDFYIDGDLLQSTPAMCNQTDSTFNDGFQFSVVAGITEIKAIDRITSEVSIHIITVVESAPLEISNATVQATSCNENTGMITIEAQGGSGTYNYRWPNNVTNTDLNVAFNLAAGNYQVIVSDANEVTCYQVITVEVPEHAPGNPQFIISDIPKVCNGEANGLISYDVSYNDEFRLPFSIELLDENNQTVENGLLESGEYCLHLYDSTGCLAADTCVLIESHDELILSVIVDDLYCEDTVGNASVSISGGIGTAPFLYYWSTYDPVTTSSQEFDVTTSGAIQLKDGTYQVRLVNSFGCEATSVFEINKEDCPDSLTFIKAPEDETVSCDQIPGIPDVRAYSPCNQGAVVTHFSEYEIDGACEGNYFIVQNWQAIDACADTITHMRFITVRDFEAPEFEGFPGDITIDLSQNNTIPSVWEAVAFDNCATTLSFDFEEKVDTTNHGYLIRRIYKVYDPCQNTASKTQTITVTGGEVWPGDTDSSGIVNQYDLFNIGLGFGYTGPSRVWSTDEWMGQYADIWKFNSPVNGVNFRHGDTNGDGRIDQEDVNNVLRNWKGETFFQNERRPLTRSVQPARLEIESVDGAGNVRMKVLIGEEGAEDLTLYGAAMHFVYPVGILDPNTMELELSGTWLGAEEDLIMMQKVDPDAAYLDFAIVRKDHVDGVGSGQIATLTFQLQPDYRNRDFDAVFTLDAGVGIDAAGNFIETSPFEENLDIISSAKETILSNQFVQIFPNPSGGQFSIQPTPDVKISHYTIFNASGNRIKEIQATSAQQLIDLSEQPEGIYLLKVTTTEGIVIKKISIAK